MKLTGWWFGTLILFFHIPSGYVKIAIEKCQL
jgi:hypothetical protein